REVLVDVTLAIRYAGNTAGRRQDFGGSYRAVDPALRLFLRCRARPAMLGLAALAVAGLRVDQPDQLMGRSIDRQNGMQCKATQGAALTDRSIAARLCPAASQRQVAGVLDHDHVAPGSPRSRAFRRVIGHLGRGHSLVAQEAAKLN